MNVLVTGGAGFLGGYLVAALAAAGHDVYAYDIAAPEPDILAVAPQLEQSLRPGSIGDLERLLAVCREDRIEVIVHAAARLGLVPSLQDPVGFYQTNILGMVNACEAAHRFGMRKLVAISSNAVYHAGTGERLVETGCPFSITHANPAAHYGTSKMAAEAIGMAYAGFHDLDFLALRVTAVYGFGMRSPLHIKPMIENGVLGRPTRFATGGAMKRDYTHVLDCCDAVVRAVAAARLPRGAQRILNVAAGNAHTVAEVATVVRRMLPAADIEIGMELTPAEAANARMRASLDVTAARQALGWSSRWPLEEGVREYVDRFGRYVALH